MTTYNKPARVKIECVETGEVLFLKDAARIIAQIRCEAGLSVTVHHVAQRLRGCISLATKRPHKTAYGFHWRRISDER